MKGGRGGFAIGLIVGLLLGLVLALGVALYVSKVPVPFVNKVPQRSAEQDAAEIERNKGWDPNAGLNGKAPAAPRPAAAGPVVAPAATPAAPATAPVAALRPAAAASPAAVSAPKSAASSADALTYFVQAGAYTRSEDAQVQRARLALQGFDTRITEREQAGRTVYRVRGGPYDARAEAEAALQRLQAAGVDASLVRVQRQ